MQYPYSVLRVSVFITAIITMSSSPSNYLWAERRGLVHLVGGWAPSISQQGDCVRWPRLEAGWYTVSEGEVCPDHLSLPSKLETQEKQLYSPCIRTPQRCVALRWRNVRECPVECQCCQKKMMLVVSELSVLPKRTEACFLVNFVGKWMFVSFKVSVRAYEVS